jgi:hypothetical protein
MEVRIWFFSGAFILIILLFVVPKLMRIRIRLLRWLRLRWFADFHERHIVGITLIARIIMVAVIIYLLARAFGG